MEKPRRRILIVDDASNWRHTLESVLKPFGFEVVLASTIMEAYEALAGKPYDAAILDVRLDSLDTSNNEGISTVLGHAHHHDPDLGFVVISSYYSEDEVKRIVPEGVSVMYIDKNNFKTDELVAALEQVSRSKYA